MKKAFSKEKLSSKRQNFDLKNSNKTQIRKFIQSQGIGIDCSGFVYNVLNNYLKDTKNISLDSTILRYKGILGFIERLLLRNARVRRCNAAILTNDLNTVKINSVNDMHIGFEALYKAMKKVNEKIETKCPSILSMKKSI